MIVEMFLGLKPPEKLSGFADPERWLVDWASGGEATASGERINEQTALTCAAVKACVTILAETVAALPLQVFERLPNGDKRLAVERPEYRILHDEPNSDTSAYSFRETLQGHLGTYGNAYAEIERAYDGTTPMALWQRSPKPEHTKPVRGPDGKIEYRCRSETGYEVTVPGRDMLHIPGFGFDGLVGYNPVRHLREPIGKSKAAERYGAELFANDATATGHYTHPSRMSQDAYERLTRDLGDGSLHGKRHRNRILEEGMEFAASSMNPEDVQMIEALRFSVEDIARAYRIPLHLLQQLQSGSSYASIVELGREFIVYTMMPWFKRWEGQLNRRVLRQPFFCEFNYAAFMQGDPPTRGEFYWKLWQMGVVTQNDVARRENMNGIGPEGDVRFVPANMVPLQVAIAGGGVKETPPTKEPKPDEQQSEEGEDEDLSRQLQTRLASLEAELRSTAEGLALDFQDTRCRTSERIEKIGRDVDTLRRGIGRCEARAGAVFLDASRRMRAIEANAARRWARHPESFLRRMDEFYCRHEIRCRDAFGPAVEAGYGDWIYDLAHDAVTKTSEVKRVGVQRDAQTLNNLVLEHIRASREALLTAAECQPEHLPERVQTVIDQWAAQAALQPTKDHSDGA